MTVGSQRQTNQPALVGVADSQSIPSQGNLNGEEATKDDLTIDAEESEANEHAINATNVTDRQQVAMPSFWNLLSSYNKRLNILLLGETGVGKSTWINGFVNYFTFGSLENVKPMINVIPIRFAMTDENYEKRVICSSDGEQDDIENYQEGHSTTQQPKNYALTLGQSGSTICLIDTPGFGDTRGFKQDRQRFANIMTHVASFNELHGICILLKPNNARLNVVFETCIKELLKEIGNKASKNIVFCFTHSRSTMYRPGDTYSALQELLKPHPKIKLSKETVYCTDNEAVRYLAATKCGIKFEEQETEYITKSWTISLSENDRLLAHFLTLKPFVLKSTLVTSEKQTPKRKC